MECAIFITNILLIITTLYSIRTSKEMQKEIQLHRFARYKTIVLYYVRLWSYRDRFDTDKKAFQRFLLHLSMKTEENRLQRIIKEDKIENSEEFLQYICEICDDPDYTFEKTRYLLR